MIPKDDPLYDAMLVESVRMHLHKILNSMPSEIFFSDMLRIAERKVYLGYKTIKGKDAKLRGIKDFIHNVHYGLGVRDMHSFLCGLTEAAVRDTSKSRYGYQLVDWLKDQDPVFNFPDELFHFRRLMRSIAYDKRLKNHKNKKYFLYTVVRNIYRDAPSLLAEIGDGRKYKSVMECYLSECVVERIETLKPISLFRNPTNHQLKDVAETLYTRLGRGKTKMLILELLEQCKQNDSQNSTGDGA